MITRTTVLTHRRKIVVPKKVRKSKHMQEFFESQFREADFKREIINSNSPIVAYWGILLNPDSFMGSRNLIAIDNKLRFGRGNRVTDKNIYRMLLDDKLIENLVILGTSKDVNNDSVNCVSGSELLELIKKGKVLLQSEMGDKKVYGVIVNVSSFGKSICTPTLAKIRAFFEHVRDSSFFILFDNGFGAQSKSKNPINPIMEGFNQTYKQMVHKPLVGETSFA